MQDGHAWTEKRIRKSHSCTEKKESWFHPKHEYEGKKDSSLLFFLNFQTFSDMILSY